MNARLAMFAALGILVLFVLSGSFYIIQESERGVKLQFGKVVDFDIKPGIHFKIPLIQIVKKFDGRVQVVDAQPNEFLTAEKKRLIVDSFIMWKIKDVERFYIRTQGDARVARMLLLPRVEDGLKSKIAVLTLAQVIADQRGKIMEDLQQELDQIADQELGIEIVDVRIKRVELPEDVTEEVYRRMRAERSRDAAEHRSQGREVAEGIRADADRQERILLAEAYRDAEKTRGEGDAIAANTYAAAYSKDAKFYEFYRSLGAYKASFGTKADIMIVDPKSEFFDYMNNARGGQ
jgi:modulator of FtsH protease HflC